jgi:branched-chain amino acid transport system permease protein
MVTLVPNIVLNAAILGIIYGLLGLSLTIVYGGMRIANLAHGDIVVAGSFIAYSLTAKFGYSPIAALPVAFVYLSLVGYGIYRIAGKRLQNSREPELASFLFFYGVSLMISASLLFVFDADTRAIAFQFKPLSFQFLGFRVPHARVIAVLVTLALVPSIFWALYRTIYGKALRGAIMNREAIRIVGIDIDRLSLFAFSISFGLAGMTGVLIALVFPAFSPFSGLDYTILGFVVIVLGGLGSPLGALAGGLVFALTEQLATLYLGQSTGLIVGFLVLVAVIVVRPAGLMGQVEWRA